MTSLEAGVQYALSSQGHFGENKSLIFVKLTDSAQRCIEEYVRSRGKLGPRPPTIQFLGNEGQLLVPSAEHGGGGRFTFSLSSDPEAEAGTTQGGFECIQRTGPRELDSLGALLCRMRVHANDDIFETTRNRMQAVEVSNKTKCTRVIKSSETVGKKVKVKGTVRKILPPAPAGSSPPPVKQRPFQSQPQRGPGKPQQQPSSGLQARRSSPPDIMRRTLRERLVHLLALRPFKRPELYERVHQDGLRDHERKQLPAVLNQVSRMHGNAYHLLAGAWSDVQDDWPFYSDEERAALKRRKPQNLTPPGASSDASSGQSPSSVRSDLSPPRLASSSSSSFSSAKRAPHEAPLANGFPQKRQRISLLSQEAAHHHNQQQQQQPLPPPPPSSNHHPVVAEQRAQPPAARDYLAEDSDNNSNPAADPDYMQAYTTIRSLEQRARYKADFLSYFEDYQRVHLQLSEITKHFVFLKEELKKKEELGDPRAYEEAKSRIIDEYNRTKHVKLRFQYLHEKLEYIKKLVADYDRQHFQSNRAY